MNILKTYKIAATTMCFFIGGVAIAQTNNTADQAQPQTGGGYVNDTWKPSLVKDGAYDRVPHTNKALEYQHQREDDILYSKRVWREVDTREKKNMPFRYRGDEATGGGYFIEILIDAIKKGKIKAYTGVGEGADRFVNALSKDQIMEMISGKPDTNTVTDPETGLTKQVITRRDFDPETITKYMIKEDWIFDRNVGKMDVRIIGIAPFKDVYGTEDGQYRGSQAMFWLYYPDIRNLLAQYEVFNPQNDIARMTWTDYFDTRQFSSRVVKVSNPFDRSFKDAQMSNMEALYEGQKVSEDIFNKEHDMWVY